MNRLISRLFPSLSPVRRAVGDRVVAGRRRALLLTLMATVMLSACSGVKTEESYPEFESQRRPHGSLTGDDGFTLFGGGRKKGEDSLPINRFLWQASLDVLSFIPLASTDPFGGVILTEWTTLAEAPNERLKLTVYITSNELRSDAVRVSVFRQKRQGNKADGAWQDAASDPKTATDLENAILTRARELRVAAAYDK
jgi:hypothetical protein